MLLELGGLLSAQSGDAVLAVPSEGFVPTPPRVANRLWGTPRRSSRSESHARFEREGNLSPVVPSAEVLAENRFLAARVPRRHAPPELAHPPTERSGSCAGWLAYYGAPILMSEMLYGGTNSLVDQSLHSRARGRAHERRRVRRRLVRRPRHPRRVSQHRTGLERPEPARARRSHQLATVLHPHPGDLQRRAADSTATRSATTAGCSCTTATSTSSPPIKRDLVLAVHLPRAILRSRVRPIPKCCSTLPSRSVCKTTLRPPSNRPSGPWKRSAERRGAPHPFQGTIATTDGESTGLFRYSSARKVPLAVLHH